MPSRAAHLIAFLAIVAISVSAHIYVYRQFAKVVRHDFPRHKDRILRWARALFIYFELPFLYIFFGRQITFDASLLTTILVYPFAAWQVLMLVWTIILVPIGLLRSRWFGTFWRTSQKLLLKPIRRMVRRTLRPRRDQALEPSEEIA